MSVFASFLNKYSTGVVNFYSTNYKAMLVSSAPTPANLKNWTFRSSATSIEFTSTTGGYTSGGIALTYTDGTLDRANFKQPIVFDDVTTGWTGITGTVAGAIVYANVGTAATDILFQYISFGGEIPLADADFGWNFAGSFYIQQS